MSKKKKFVVYANKYETTNSPDEREAYRSPQAEARFRRELEKLKEMFEKEESEKRRIETESESLERDKEAEIKKKKESAFDPSHDVGIRKFRRKRSKAEKIGVAKKILDNALGVDAQVENFGNVPGVRSMSEELYDDGVSQDAFLQDVLRDYESDLKKLYEKDNNKDGKVDDDDITPGMKTMMKYM